MSEAVFSQEAVGETRAWLEHIHAELEKKPARELFARFNRDLTIQVVNQASQFIQRAFDWRAEEGQQKIDEAQFRKAKCSLYLYYKVLQGVLLGERFATPEGAQGLADNTPFVEALLLVAVELVSYAWHGGGALFPATTLRLERLHLAFDMWEATDLFRQHLGSADTAGAASPAEHAMAGGTAGAGGVMPAAAAEYLGYMRVRITEEFAFLNGSTLYAAMLAGGGGSRAPGDKSLVADFIATAAFLARERCFRVCMELAASVPAISRLAGFEAQAQALLDHTQNTNYQVLFNQHQLNIVSCCVSATARVLGAPLPFKKVNEAIAAVFPSQPPALFTEADLNGAAKEEVRLGDTRALYNDIFLPAMEDHLQALAATYKIRGLSAGGADAESPVPPAKLHETARRPVADAAAASGGKRHPFAALSTSDRNARRNSSIL